MGVVGLLQLLKSIQRPVEVKKYSGETLGVDAYGWLHRGAVACASELAQGKPTRVYVDFALRRVNMLRHFGVKPYLVFDGDYLPSKARVEASRCAKREESAKRGIALLEAGKKKEAYMEFQKAIDITPEMARYLMEDLKKMGVPYVVAPYEADAQLVYLERKGIIDGILSDDSDLLVFGAKKLITKLDQYGACIEINRRDFCACREVSLTSWSDKDFRRMAILSGCDYLDGIRSVGLKTAYRYMRKHKTPERVVQMLQFEGKTTVSEDYLPSFYQAELTFLHQRVFCPEKKELVMLTEDPTGKAEDYPFIGAPVEPEIARGVAVGDLNPMTKAPMAPIPMVPRKRRSPSTTSRMVPPAPNRPPPAAQIAGSKPINSYFKGHRRIPLGEMDRNCFTVDPKRIADITQNGMVSRVFPLPRPYTESPSTSEPAAASSAQETTSPALSGRLNQRRSQSLATSLLAAGPTGQTSRPAPRAETNGANELRISVASPSSQRPPKKARLCMDAGTASDSTQATPEKSKFFPRRTPKKQKPAVSPAEGYLMSDDSIDEALLALPDVGGFRSPEETRSAFRIFGDEPSDTAKETLESETTQDEGIDVGHFHHEMLPPPPPAATGKSEKKTPPRVSLRRFFFRANSMASPEDDLGVETPPSVTSSTFSHSRRSSDVSTPSTVATSIAPSSIRPMMTPLQRIQARALGKDAGLDTPSNRKPAKPSLFASMSVNPSFVPLPTPDAAEISALNSCGSEDMIARDDEADEEAVHGERESNNSAKLDFTRFLYR